MGDPIQCAPACVRKADLGKIYRRSSGHAGDKGIVSRDGNQEHANMSRNVDPTGRPHQFPKQCCFRVIYFSFTLFPTFSFLLPPESVGAADVETIRLMGGLKCVPAFSDECANSGSKHSF